ncbi:MAG: transaldolase, partial [Dehalococcoidia bacterium]
MSTPLPRRPRTLDLLDAGQSVWLDSISRAMLREGRLQRMVDDGWVTGVTSNPSIFEKAVSGSSDYDAPIRAAAAAGVTDPYEAFVALAVDDIRDACDVLRPVYDQTGARDGFVSLEIPPGVEVDTAKTVAEAERLARLVCRPNVMIKVPGTPAGLAAVEQLIAMGININITLLFSLAQYEATAEAYLAGLERRLSLGQRLDTVASVASFFVSRLDTAVDPLLSEGSPLRGKAAVGNARAAYARFETIFSGPRWAALEAAGARVQRPLWASTGTKNPAYSDVLYVDELVAPHTVNTMPEATLAAVLDHGSATHAIAQGLAASLADLRGIAAAGVDLDAVTDRLLVEGLAAFDKDFRKLLDRIAGALTEARVLLPRGSAALAELEHRVTDRLGKLDETRTVARIWARDHTVWKTEPTEISDRLGWLDVFEAMREEVPALEAFAAELAAEGFETAVLLGMGGSSLAPEVFQQSFGTAKSRLRLAVLDSTHPDQISALEATLDLAKTVFIAASKSGGTVETRSQLEYFWEKLRDGRQFIAITDAGSSLDALATERGFRRVFRARPDIGGRFSASGHFGLVPAALIGAP